MTLATRTVILPGGLQATLVHQPQADRAAALARVAAGSHHEPSRFPGLAHLLEHLLFYGGERYQDDDRLMGWVQRQGGSVNATTLARHSAFFFEVAADALADGVARLQEMLQAPLLLREDIQREVAVIDAEYRLIQQHEPSRREAAVRHAASAPAAFRRFQVGSADALAGDLAALQAALGDFHRTHYVARRMQLWLQGPQSLEALGELAARFAAGLAAGEPPPPAPPLRLGEFTALQLAVSSQPALWRCPLIALSDNVTLLREFLLDEAPGSLMASLRQRRLAGDVALNWLYQDRYLGWLALVFASDRPEEVDRQITHWLQALQQTTPEQQQHYYQLSRRRFQALSPLDQLRQRAFGFAPGAPPAGFADFCAALQAAPSVSLACQTVSPWEPVATQGFSLPLSRWRRRPESDPALAFAFYPQAAGDLVAKCPEKAAPLLHLPLPEEPPRLLLRPPFYYSPDQAEGLARGEQLRPLLAALRHAGGHGEWHLFDGSWQLTLQLPEPGRRPEAILQAILRQLALPVASLTKLQFDLMLTDDFIDPHRDATDILFRISSLPDAGYHARVFGSQRYYLTASPEYVSRYGSPTSPEALHQHRTLVYGGSQGANRWLFRQREEAWVHYPLTPLMTSNNADALLTSAIGGMGIVLFPDWMVSGALHNGTLVTLMDRYSAAISHTPSYIAAIYPYTRHPSLNVRTVIDYFADVFGSPPYWQR